MVAKAQIVNSLPSRVRVEEVSGGIAKRGSSGI